MKRTHFKKKQLRRFYNAQNLPYNNVEVPCEELFVIMHDLGKEFQKIKFNSPLDGNQNTLKIMKTCLERLQKPFSFTCLSILICF
jgi:hypothetical protein